MKENYFAQRFTARKLLWFALPNIIMQMFLSTYTIVDGMFVSRYVGTVALGSTNIIWPVICIQLAISVMLASGGSAIVSYQMGSGKPEQARQTFTLIVLTGIVLSLVFILVCYPFMPQLSQLLGASPLQLDYCITYGRITLLLATPFFLQVLFQTFFVTAGHPTIGLVSVVFGGLTNVVLDYLFMKYLQWGITGAALATGLASVPPAVCGLVFFLFHRTGSLYFTMPSHDWKALLRTCSNGASEMVTNLANAVTTILFNYVFMYYYGEDGVASIAIVLYFQFVFSAFYFGYSSAVAPIIGYKYGARDNKQLKYIIRFSYVFVACVCVFTYFASRRLISPAMHLFADSSSTVFSLTIDGFPLFALSFLFMGINIFSSSMFTALSNGLISAVISFGRTFLFLSGSIILLPMLIGADGVWLAIAAAELLGFAVSAFCFVHQKKKYQY